MASVGLPCLRPGGHGGRARVRPERLSGAALRGAVAGDGEHVGVALKRVALPTCRHDVPVKSVRFVAG